MIAYKMNLIAKGEMLVGAAVTADSGHAPP